MRVLSGKGRSGCRGTGGGESTARMGWDVCFGRVRGYGDRVLQSPVCQARRVYGEFLSDPIMVVVVLDMYRDGCLSSFAEGCVFFSV